MFEVENKYPIAEAEAVQNALAELGVELNAGKQQVDSYYAHPGRDFAQTDEALRLRQDGDNRVVTYKGPKIDKTTKTRKEIELPLGTTSLDRWRDLLEALGFRPVAEVRKWRRTAEVDFEGRSFEVAWDDVDEVGLFLELETSADEAQRAAATDALEKLATQLKLPPPERRSYLEMLLTKRGRG